MTEYEMLFEKIKNFCEKSEKVKAMVLFGSRARTEKPADEFSDYDIIMFVTDVNYFAHSDEWLSEIAPFYISFVENTAVQDKERRIFFDNAMDIDFILYNAADMEKIIADPIIKSWFSKGYRVIIDKYGCENRINELAPFRKETKPLSESDFINTVHTFWFHTIWAVKKLNRGEIWAAKNCIDGYLKTLLREILEYDAAARNGKCFDTWHDGRFFDQWADKNIIDELDNAYGGYGDITSLVIALRNTMDLFSEKAVSVSEAFDYNYPRKAEEYARNQINSMI